MVAEEEPPLNEASIGNMCPCGAGTVKPIDDSDFHYSGLCYCPTCGEIFRAVPA